MSIHASENNWILETRNTAYVFGINAAGLLKHRYWGVRLPNQADYPAALNWPNWASFNNAPHLAQEEYPGYNEMKFIEPALKISFPGGVRDVVLRFERAATEGEQLYIHLRDTYFHLNVTLIYTVHAAEDIIERTVTLSNFGDQPMTIERVFSAQWHLPYGDQYRFTHLSGRWFDEFKIQQENLKPGVKVIESRRINTSHHANPWFALDRGGADEDQGEVWFGALSWSGNWKIAAEVTDFASTRVNVGLNDWDFAWALKPGETFNTPSAFAGYTVEGFGGASRKLHDLIRGRLPNPKTPHRIHYNSWEAVFFNVDVQSQIAAAEMAAGLGIELFVMDDGWFHKRDDDHAALGDWWPDERKFPDGLKPLIDRVKALGMDFGLWLEPEMVNKNSDLYRAHPDWVLHYPHRERTEGRNQLILNMARQDVQDYLIEKLDGLLGANDITFIKWDMNRSVSEAGWPEYEGEQREIWVRYVQGLYRVWNTLKERHPKILWQSCSGGGGRADMDILKIADEIHVSDNTGAAARLGIQEGFSMAYPAITMEAQVSDMEAPIPVAFRFHVAMSGMLGMSCDLTKWSAAELDEARKWIAVYKEIRSIVQFGDQYRLRPAQAGSGYSAVQYMSKDKAEGVVFAFRTHIPDPANPLALRLRGLEAEAQYTVEGFEGARSGQAWMHSDNLFMLKNFESTVRKIKRV